MRKYIIICCLLVISGLLFVYCNGLCSESLIFHGKDQNFWQKQTYNQIVKKIGQPNFQDTGIKYMALWQEKDKDVNLFVRFKYDSKSEKVIIINSELQIESVKLMTNKWCPKIILKMLCKI